MEGLDDIIDLEEENTPPVWGYSKPPAKSSRYAALQARNYDDVLREDMKQISSDMNEIPGIEEDETSLPGSTRFARDDDLLSKNDVDDPFLSDNLSKSQAEWLKSEMIYIDRADNVADNLTEAEDECRFDDDVVDSGRYNLDDGPVSARKHGGNIAFDIEAELAFESGRGYDSSQMRVDDVDVGAGRRFDIDDHMLLSDEEYKSARLYGEDAPIHAVRQDTDDHIEDHLSAVKTAGRDNIDDRPIKSGGQYKFDDNIPASSRKGTLDDRPIKSGGQYKFDDNMPASSRKGTLDDRPIKTGGQYKFDDDRPIKNARPYKFDDDIELDDAVQYSFHDDIPTDNTLPPREDKTGSSVRPYSADDRPIGSAKQHDGDERAIGSGEHSIDDYDDRPSSARQHGSEIPVCTPRQDPSDERPIKSAGQYKFDDNIPTSGVEMDDRPTNATAHLRSPVRTIDAALAGATSAKPWDDTIRRDVCANRHDTLSSRDSPAFDGETAASLATSSTACTHEVQKPLSPEASTTKKADGSKKPFLRKGARTISTLRPKGGPVVSFPTRSPTLVKEEPAQPRSPSAPSQAAAAHSRTPSAPSQAAAQSRTPSGPSQTAAQSRTPSVPSYANEEKNSYKAAYNARQARPTSRVKTKSAQDLMWNEDSDEMPEEKVKEKHSFMDFMRDKGLSDKTLSRMAVRSKPDATRQAFGSDDVDASDSLPANCSPREDDLPGHGQPTKKGFRDYYRDKFGSPEKFEGLCAAVREPERARARDPREEERDPRDTEHEKRAFRDLYHNKTDSQKKAEASYASLWQDEVARKTQRKWDEPQEREEYDKDSAPVSNLVRKHFYKEDVAPKKPVEPVAEPSEESEDMKLLLQQKLTLLDAQIARFKKENEQCKKLRLEREQALRDAEKDRENMQSELMSVRDKMREELEEDQEKLKRERKRLDQDRERHRQLLTQGRADQDEIAVLRQQVADLKEEHAQKEQRWRRTVDRLQKQNDELKKKCQEANDEIAWAQKTPAMTTANNRRSGSTAAAKAPINATPPPSATEAKARAVAPRGAAPSTATSSDNKAPKVNKSVDGRVERTFPDGGREIEFPNGLKKILQPDGSSSVQFANGDTKECKVDGSVVYRYHGTRATQTTLPDGTELFEFASGQTETHFPDGSKEISFPNGNTKKIAADGTENISFTNGATKTVRPKA